MGFGPSSLHTECRTKRCSEREPADSLGDESNVIGGWLPSLTFALAARKLLPKAYELAYDRANQEGIPCKSLLPVKQEQTFTG